MKIYLILGLLCMGVTGEQKINLDDIERDNLRVEGISKSGISQSEGSKYLAKPVIGQQQYQIPNQYRGPPPPPSPPAGSSVTYVTPPPVQNYPTETYVQPGKYAKKEQIYQQQNNYQEQILPQRYYNEYQQEPLLFPKRIAPNVYESQQLAYQPEVNIGNQLQPVQQKVISPKFTKNVNKGQEYVNIPMMHLLTYYPNLNVNSGKTNGLFVPQLATTATNHISIPVYTSTLSQRPVVSARPTYEIQYTPKHNAAVSNKITKGAAYTAPVNSKRFSGSPADSPADQTYAQGRQFLYTQAYIAPSQPQYVSQLVYAQPTAVYMQATPVYSDVYVHPSNYDQDNSLQGSARYTAPVEQLQSTVAIADELPNQGLGQQSSQSVTQNYIKEEPDELNTDLVPPQIPPQDFKSDTESVSSQDEELIPEQNHVISSEPASLLDSYVPSNVIAAQDSSRYQERPIKLERGFLPSKENFLYKKRKVE
ncbi:uncharacterized protein LOC122529104 [Frieseomelitta varia]|uniref:uncharacterized protein LOC122529104 n=1 Tax=Frieseomelitta varia TaxID=561572 RepID=UPI001CB699EA|nr:uncharacterized protein LOC122529104 [Frieseomelitta varia]